MKVTIDEKMTSREILDSHLNNADVLREKFAKMWEKIDKGLSNKEIDSLPSDGSATITFSIQWEGEGECCKNTG